MLPKPARELVAYFKTDELESGEEQQRVFDISEYELSSYDEEGATGYKACWVLEYGDYEFFVGENVRESTSVGSVRFDKKSRASATRLVRRKRICPFCLDTIRQTRFARICRNFRVKKLLPSSNKRWTDSPTTKSSDLCTILNTRLKITVGKLCRQGSKRLSQRTHRTEYADRDCAKQ